MTAPTLRPFTEVIDAIRRAAAESPRKKASAAYFRDGQPCCIVGWALAEFGVVIDPDDVLPRWHADEAHTLPWTEFGVAAPSIAERVWIRIVQGRQDNLWFWADAVESVDHEYPLEVLA